MARLNLDRGQNTAARPCTIPAPITIAHRIGKSTLLVWSFDPLAPPPCTLSPPAPAPAPPSTENGAPRSKTPRGDEGGRPPPPPSRAWHHAARAFAPRHAAGAGATPVASQDVHRHREEPSVDA